MPEAYNSADQAAIAAGLANAGVTLTRSVDVTCLGDSRTRYNYYVSAASPDATWDMNATGYAFWAQTLSMARVRIPAEYNFGVSGDTTTQMLARLPSALATPASAAIVFGSVNDRSNSMTADQSIANLQAIILGLRNAGKRVYVICELISTALSGVQLAYQSSVRDWIKRTASRLNNVVIVDPVEDMADTSGSSPGFLPFMSRDGLHYTPRGAYYIGKSLAKAFIADYPAVDCLMHLPFEAYGANNVRGNLLSNGLMKGAGGTLSGTSPTPTGTVADNWTLASSSGAGLTIAGSKVTGTQITGLDGSGNANRLLQQVVVGGTPTLGFPAAALTFVPSTANLSAGDVIEGFAYVEVDAGAVGLTGLRHDVRIQDNVPTSFFAAAGSQWPDVNDYFMPSEAWSGVIRTPRLTVPPNAASILSRFFVQGKQNAAIAATVRVGCVSLQKVF